MAAVTMKPLAEWKERQAIGCFEEMVQGFEQVELQVQAIPEAIALLCPLLPTSGDPSTIAPELQWALVCWVIEGQLPGSFLQAVLRNDLQGAITRADERSVASLRTIMLWLLGFVPSSCWGSPEAVEAWQARGGIRGARS